MHILLVDNITDRHRFFIDKFIKHELDIADSYELAVEYLSNKVYDVVFIGGELGYEGGRGSQVAEFLDDSYDNPNNGAYIITHTWDLIEVELIIDHLPNVSILPFDENVYLSLDI